MTTFKYGDKVLLPEWLGGGEATFKDDGVRGSGRGQVALGLAVIFLPIIELTKAPTPEPTKIGYIHIDKNGERFVLVDCGNGGWRRVSERQYAWEQISN